MPRFTGWLRPVVDAVARVKAGVHRKLLFGFLAGALLLVAMAAPQPRRHPPDERPHGGAEPCAGEGRPGAGDALRGHGAEPLPGDGAAHPGGRRQVQRPGRGRQGRPSPSCSTTWSRPSRRTPRSTKASGSVNEDYRQSGQRVLALFDQGQIPQAAALHLSEEHPTSHKLEASMRTLIAGAKDDMATAQSDFRSARRPLHRHGDRLLRDERDRGAAARASSSRGRSSCRSARCSAASRTSPPATSTSASRCRTATSSARWRGT